MGAVSKAIKSITGGGSKPAVVGVIEKASPAAAVKKSRGATTVANGRTTRSRAKGRISLINEERSKTLG